MSEKKPEPETHMNPQIITMFAGYNLQAIDDEGPRLYWQLRNTDSVFTITNTPGGVCIKCDGQHWTSNVPFIDFIGELDTKYLGQKFLTKRWTRTSAEGHLTYILRKLGMLSSEGVGGIAEAIREVQAIANGDPSLFESKAGWEKNLGSELDDLVNGTGRYNDPVLDVSERTPPLAFVEEDVGRLTALHHRFRETFMADYKIEDGRPVRKGRVG